MRITAGMIVHNGEPFVGYALRAIYDFIDEIIVVEGAVEKAVFAANPDGSSTDGTVETLRSFPDPDNKITLIQGKWQKKLDQSQAWFDRATGDYVWIVDSDEMYLPHDIVEVKQMLEHDPEITVVSFYHRTFWHNLHTELVGPPWEGNRDVVYERIFKRGPGYRYIKHRHPTVVDADGVSLVDKKLVRANEMRRRGIFIYHYSYVDADQVWRKMQYHRARGSTNAAIPGWYEKVYMAWLDDPAGVELKYGTFPNGTGGWTQPYYGPHPPAMYEHPLMQKEKDHVRAMREHLHPWILRDPDEAPALVHA